MKVKNKELNEDIKRLDNILKNNIYKLKNDILYFEQKLFKYICSNLCRMKIFGNIVSDINSIKNILSRNGFYEAIIKYNSDQSSLYNNLERKKQIYIYLIK